MIGLITDEMEANAVNRKYNGTFLYFDVDFYDSDVPWDGNSVGSDESERYEMLVEFMEDAKRFLNKWRIKEVNSMSIPKLCGHNSFCEEHRKGV